MRKGGGYLFQNRIKPHFQPIYLSQWLGFKVLTHYFWVVDIHKSSKNSLLLLGNKETAIKSY